MEENPIVRMGRATEGSGSVASTLLRQRMTTYFARKSMLGKYADLYDTIQAMQTGKGKVVSNKG